ncbi:anti-anti-sigma factor [Chitinivorax tropicus]|uniref:Anti-anti-sigma factor n=1 Tax=Chitinivorax tropicus TaxID=714531 RepID=A0A840MJY1_9PROT|nr:STAS domain-containing protein [Chitinivorax tropicus]MBB5017137.1 anti-anti-sigma factor [Chitinivorax tropicus]
MQIRTERSDRKMKLILAGYFTFDAYREFKNQYTPLLESGDFSELEIDLGQVEYLDSSALGMLLLLRERMDNKPVVLSNAQGTVKQVLEVANFHHLFTMR